jgi:peptidoglycan/xylan/chitin deacetylase (PgdA/CDA1 family)
VADGAAVLRVAAVSVLAALAATLAPAAQSGETCALRFPDPLPRRGLTVPILMYHRIDVVHATTPAITRRLTVAPDVFAAQMRWLVRHRYHSITQRQLFAALMCGSALPAKPVMITFDDGYRDVFFEASSTLLQLGLHATAYVITGRVSGPDSSFLTWTLLRALEARGIEVGSHTVTHVELTSVSDAAALGELVESRRALGRALGHAVPWLAYPSGRYDVRVEALARRAGYLLATTTDVGTSQSAERPLALQRLRVLDSTGVSGLAALLAAHGA